MNPYDDRPVEPLGPGDELGPFRIHRRLRSPPGTELYQAGSQHDPEGSLVRLEVYIPELEERELFVQRWSEVLHFARFRSPHVLPILNMGGEGRRHYVALPWISARSLLACLEDDRGLPWPVDAALCAAWNVASGLEALHQWKLNGQSMQVVYRAIGPETLIISAQGRALLRPAPLAEGLIPRRPFLLERVPYLSPEAVRASTLTPASDVAALGAVLYRLLAGIHPYRARSPIEALKATLEGRFTPLRSMRAELPVPVEQLVHRMMAREPSERPRDGAALVVELELAAVEAGITLEARALRRARKAMSQQWK